MTQQFLNALRVLVAMKEHCSDAMSKVMEAEGRQAKLIPSAVKPAERLSGAWRVPTLDGDTEFSAFHVSPKDSRLRELSKRWA